MNKELRMCVSINYFEQQRDHNNSPRRIRIAYTADAEIILIKIRKLNH